jgi:hypothetical protein
MLSTASVNTLKKLIEGLAKKLGDASTDGISLSFNSRGGWSWVCRVDRQTKPHGRGHRVTRGELYGYGDTPGEAVEEIARKIAIPGYLDIT